MKNITIHLIESKYCPTSVKNISSHLGKEIFARPAEPNDNEVGQMGANFPNDNEVVQIVANFRVFSFSDPGGPRQAIVSFFLVGTLSLVSVVFWSLLCHW